jgi:hypothetical protein
MNGPLRRIEIVDLDDARVVTVVLAQQPEVELFSESP